MPTDIETQIFKLELDGSGYIQGADQLAASTKKLSTEQEKANKVLKDLQIQQNGYKKQLEDLTPILKANEKETLDLTKQLNDLKAAGKGASAEAKSLQAALRGIATNTKEFKIEANELTKNLNTTTTQLKNQTKVVGDLEKANGGLTKSLGSAYTGLSKIAQIIPGLGIGGLIGLIAGPLIEGIQKWISSLGGVNNALQLMKANQQNVTEVMAAANKEAGKQITDLKILYQAATDVNIPMKERLAAVNSLQKEFPAYFKNIKDEAILNGDAKSSYDALTLSIISRARATAAKAKLDEIESQRLDLQFSKQKVINATSAEAARVRDKDLQASETREIEAIGSQQILSAKAQKETIKIRKDAALADIKLKDDALAAQSKFLIDFAGLGNIAESIEEKNEKKFKEKKVKEKKEIENVFLQEKAALDARLAEANRKEAEDESRIRIEFAARLAKEKIRIQELLSDKKLTKPQAGILTGEATEINTVLLQKALDDLRKKTIAAREKLNAELIALQDKNTQDQLNLIQDEFNRRSQLIDFNEKKELDNSKANTDKRLAALDLERLLIGEKAYQDGKAILINEGEQAALNIIQKFANQRKDLSSDIFQSLLQQYDNAIKGADLIRDEQTAKEVTALAEKLKAGEISYEKFQKEIQKIQKKSDLDSKIGTLEVDKGKLQALDRQLAAIEDKYSESYKKLKKQRDDQAFKVAKEEIALAKDQDKPEADPRFARIAKYAESIGSVIQAVINFWQKANEAESNALDRSISLQEKRVEAAQRIAARGNAQYLKQEEDRLKELTIKRENAARRELGINAALQASQLLVGITGAIAKIATPGIGIAETIGAIAVIFGALATGYGLVKSLQGNQPKLFKGSKYVTRDGNPSGIDTIPAMINEGEAVIPTSTNKAYHPAIAAIYDGSIPPEHLNSFVNNYHKIKSVPSPNYDRLRETAEFHIGENGRMSLLLSDNNRKLDESNDIGRQTLKTLHKLGVNVSLDQHGFAVTQMEVIEQMRKNKRL